MARKNLSSRVLGALSWLVVCSPIWVYLVEVPSFGRLQHNDYYKIVHDVSDGNSLTHDPLRWLSLKSNEHRATLPALVYALNMALTDGHNLGLTVFSLFLLTVVLCLLVGLLPSDIGGDPRARLVWGFALALFCYTPVTVHNVAMGFSGTIWFFANALAVAAIFALTRLAGPRRAGRPSPWALWPVLLLGTLAAFTYSSHLVLWPVLVAGAFFLRLDGRRLALLAGGTVLFYSLFAATYQPLPYHPELETRDAAGLLSYAAAYFGSLFSADLAVAKTVGWVGLPAGVLFLALTLSQARHSSSLKRDLAPWLMIMLYGLGSGLGTAVGRSGFGEGQALSSRYASLAALFWIGLLTLVGILAWRRRTSSRLGRAAAALALAGLVAGLAAAMHRRGGPLIDGFVTRGNRQEVAALAIVYDLDDDEIIKQAVAPWPIHVWRLRDFLEARGHVPFDRVRHLRVGERIAARRLSDRPPAGLDGYFDRLVRLPDGAVRLGGWAFSPEAEIAEVLVLDGDGTVCGELVTGILRPDLVPIFGDRALEGGWEGYALIPRGEIRAHARIAGDPMLYPLATTEGVAGLLRGEDS